MKPARLVWTPLFALLILPPVMSAQNATRVQQQTAHGVLEGVVSADGQVRTFKGIPYAAPPLGPLRWQPPQPVVPWSGVRDATKFGPRAMQGRIWDDMFFFDDGPSEDCLYLNVWRPETDPNPKLPVMVWIHGGGFIAGATSEPRQDGGNLCQKGVLVVSMNYRMGIFGFLAHPELTAESAHPTSGNYGLMDIIAALEWVRDHIATFGGDPNNVTIFGESAGSSAVSVLMAAPPARGLFHRAIGESGTIVRVSRPMPTRAEAEAYGMKFAQSTYGTTSLAELRALAADELLAPTVAEPRPRFGVVIDGFVLPADGRTVFGLGQQAKVPLLAGWNRDESSYRALFGEGEPTLANYAASARVKFGRRAEDFLQAYAANSDAEAKRLAEDFGTDDGIGFPTWKWLELHRATSGAPVYRYLFDQALPLPADAPAGAEPRAAHSWEIEYVFRVISSKQLPWRDEDHAVSDLMATYWTNFAKTGNPNGPGVPAWPASDAAHDFSVMRFANGTAAAAPDAHRDRYEFLDALSTGR